MTTSCCINPHLKFYIISYHPIYSILHQSEHIFLFIVINIMIPTSYNIINYSKYSWPLYIEFILPLSPHHSYCLGLHQHTLYIFLNNCNNIVISLNILLQYYYCKYLPRLIGGSAVHFRNKIKEVKYQIRIFIVTHIHNKLHTNDVINTNH